MQKQKGFTLIELMITVAIISVISMVVLPVYTSYITGAKISSAQADLISLSMNMEGYLQNKVMYPSKMSGTETIKGQLTGWIPAQSGDFDYSISDVSNTTVPPSYTLQGIGKSGSVKNCTIQLTSANIRTLSGCPGGATSW